MKKKLMRMPKVVTILVVVLIVAIFLGSMDVAAFFSCRYSFASGLWKQYDRRVYGRSGCISAFMPVWLFWSAGRKRKGIYPWPLYWRIPDRILLSGTGGTALCTDDDTGCKSVSALEILFFAATMFLIGWTEELIFRGVILNLFLEPFFQNEKRDSLGGHSQWCIVRGGTV